jgi:drug/metabolite transporter (DMT)-like permease
VKIRDTALEGVLYGALGVLIFSFTLPATRTAAPVFGGFTVGFGRAVLAGMLAALILAANRERFPERRHWRGLFIVVLGVIVGFPVLTSVALQVVPSSHGAVVVGLLPAATAVMGVIRNGDRPPLLFWVASAIGTVTVVVFTLADTGGQIHIEDLFLVAAVALGALGYTEGGRLAREMGGWRVISWALVFAQPILIPGTIWAISERDIVLATAGAPAILGFLYVAFFSQYIGFFAWYRGLALGGIARISQVQLMQSILTLIWSALLLRESLTPATLIAALIVIACVALTQWSYRRAQAATPPKRLQPEGV